MTLKKNTQRLAQQLFGAIAFYTTIPVSARWTLDFDRIARWSPLVGLLIGAILVSVEVLLRPLTPTPLRSSILVLTWVALTGALHLDGAMDTADGLGVWDPEKRLEVMVDSRSGAFGVIAAIAILLLKVSALMVISTHREMALLWIPVWGRCAHVLAVGQYPYLKSSGKGRMHHDSFEHQWDYIPSIMLQILMIVVAIEQPLAPKWLWLGSSICGFASISWATGYWFCRKFGGVTGDIHGAVVEWTETFLLIFWVVALPHFNPLH